MGTSKRPETLNKFLSYVLGRRPDEFGLVPGPEGWVRVKDLLRALSEEEGWKHVRQAHINEVVLTVTPPLIQLEGNSIRSVEWDGSLHNNHPASLPKLLFVGVRKKTYPEMDKKGIFPVGALHVVLAAEKSMAERMGRRRDAKPVILTVNTDQAKEKGVTFLAKGELLYTADFIPLGCFSGPPISRIIEEEAPKKSAKPKPESDPALAMGAFAMDLGRVLDPAALKQPGQGYQNNKGRKKRSWKEDRRRDRRRGGEE